MNYVMSLEEVAWGIALVAITMAIHGGGMLGTLLTSHLLKQSANGTLTFFRGSAVVIVATWMIILIHLVELLVWAGFLVWKGALPGPSVAYHFVLMQYTTVGSSSNLPVSWRLLEGLLPMAGLMTFAWSTGVLFTLAQEFQSSQLTVIHARRRARRAERTA